MTMSCAPSIRHARLVPGFDLATPELPARPARPQEEPLAVNALRARVQSDPCALDLFQLESPHASWRHFQRGSARFEGEFEHAAHCYLVVSAGARDSRVSRAALSPREHEVVRIAARGLSNKEIAYEIGIATSTASVHLMNAARKLGVRSRQTLIRIARWLQEGPSPVAALPPTGLCAYAFDRGGDEVVVFRIPVQPVDVPRHLSDAEREVVRLLLDGHSNAGIAQARGRSPRTVANQVASVLRKLGVGSRSELAARLNLGSLRAVEPRPSPPSRDHREKLPTVLRDDRAAEPG